MKLRSFMGSAFVACSVASPVLAQAGHTPAKLVSGTMYETTTTVTSSMASNIGMTSRQRTIEVDGKMRTEILELTGPGGAGAKANPMMGSPGTYLISADGHLYSVDTVKREYFEMNPRQLLAKGSEMMKALESMNLKISDQKIDAKDMGDGGSILGHPTSHWQLSQSMTMSAAMNGDSMAMTGETTTDMYFARDLHRTAKISLGDSVLMKDFLGSTPFGDMKKSAAVYAKLPNSIPLKSVQNGVMTVGPMEVTTTTTAQVTKVEKGKFRESLFRVPPGYKLVEMKFPAMPPLPSAER